MVTMLAAMYNIIYDAHLWCFSHAHQHGTGICGDHCAGSSDSGMGCMASSLGKREGGNTVAMHAFQDVQFWLRARYGTLRILMHSLQHGVYGCVVGDGIW